MKFTSVSFVLASCLSLIDPFVSAQGYQMPPSCGANPNGRMEWRDMSEDQRSTYINAMQCIKRNGQYDALAAEFSDVFVKVTQDAGDEMYLPVLRAFLHKFEGKMRACEANVVITYYDWSLDAANPGAAGIWNYFGHPRANGCIKGSSFESWTYAEGGKQVCIKRLFDPSSANISSLPGPRALGELISSLDSVADFSKQMQYQLFTLLLSTLGGNTGTLCGLNSIAQDPIFFLTLTYLDMLYFHWQQANPQQRLKQYAGAAVDIPIYNIDGLVVSNVLNTLDLCYTYLAPGCHTGAFSQVGPAVSFNANGTIVNVTVTLPPPSQPVSEDFCRRIGYAVSTVRSCEKVQNKCHETVQKKVDTGVKCYGPGAKVPASYSGTDAYPSYKVDVVDSCKLAANDIKTIIPSYNTTTSNGYSYGDGAYIKAVTTSVGNSTTNAAWKAQLTGFTVITGFLVAAI